MRDGSPVHLAKIEQLSHHTPTLSSSSSSSASSPTDSKDRVFPITWLTQDVGRQLLTGSFHPLDDNQWSDAIAWHISLTRSPSGVPRHTFASLFGAIRVAYASICAKVRSHSIMRV